MMDNRPGKWLDIPCACRFEEDEETIVAFCDAHKAALRDARRQALEEAAKLADSLPYGASPAWTIAGAIRALIAAESLSELQHLGQEIEKG